MKYCVLCGYVTRESHAGYNYCQNPRCDRYGLLSVYVSKSRTGRADPIK